MSNYIRFDWAMKRLLRDKANFAVLEGLMTTLMKKKIIIKRLLESESNQESEYDKYNRVDLLAEDETGELLLFEIQNNNEYAYFQRMLFGTSKLVTEYINRGDTRKSGRYTASTSYISPSEAERTSCTTERPSSGAYTTTSCCNSRPSRSRRSRRTR